jgi:hypothetical protein
MHGSRKQYWILEMIKGVDLIPAGGTPGRYSGRGRMTITAERGEWADISPDDIMDLSDPDWLRIEAPGRSLTFSWNQIRRIEFDTPVPLRAPVLEPAYQASIRRLLPFPLGKKAV